MRCQKAFLIYVPGWQADICKYIHSSSNIPMYINHFGLILASLMYSLLSPDIVWHIKFFYFLFDYSILIILEFETTAFLAFIFFHICRFYICIFLQTTLSWKEISSEEAAKSCFTTKNHIEVATMKNTLDPFFFFFFNKLFILNICSSYSLCNIWLSRSNIPEKQSSSLNIG